MANATEIVGGSVLGCGFNALGSYDPSSLMQRVFTHSFSQGNEYTYQPTGAVYQVPDNAVVVPYTPIKGGTQVFLAQQDLQSYLSITAGLSGGYNGFYGTVDAAYSSAVEEWGSIYYALTNASVGLWMVSLAKVDIDAVDPAFKAALLDLPGMFDSNTLENYFGFLRQYGTHFVHSAGAGGYFSYYQGVENSGSTSMAQVSVKCELEYNAVFIDAGVKSQADWAQLGQQWATTRSATVAALGGNASSLSNVSPVFDSNEAGSYQNWLSSIESNPSAIQFQLQEWSVLLPPGSGRQKAMRQATAAYMNHNIYVSAIFDGSSGHPIVTAGGGAVTPAACWPPQPQSLAQGIELVLIDNIDNLSITFSAVYYMDSSGSAKGLFDQIMQDLSNYADADFQWCAVTVFNMPFGVIPDSRLLGWLAQFGIFGGKWTDNYYNCGAGQSSLSYVGLGLYGAHSASESICFNYVGYDSVLEVSVNPFLESIGAKDG